MRWSAFILLGAALAACGSDSSGGDCVSFTQWGRDPSHGGAVCVTGQPTSRVLAQIFYDPFVLDEKEQDDDEILVHYQAPLIVDDDLYMMTKSGTYTVCDRAHNACDPYYRSSQVWVEKGFRWEGAALNEKWMFATDWKPEPSLRFEPMFQPAVAGDFIYVPGLGGSVHKLSRKTGTPVTRIAPFGATLDPDTYVASAVTTDDGGNVYYTALKLDHAMPYSADATGWLVKITPAGVATTKTFQEIVTGAPGPNDLCRTSFTTNAFPLPWPPADVDGQPVLAPQAKCLSQRPGINAAPVIGDDGTIFVVSRAHANERTSFLVAVRPDLTTKWARSLSKVLNDGCGVIVPIDNQSCRTGTRMGVDPLTNEMPSARVTDSSSSAPVALPDGAVLYGAFTGYNGARGHLVKLDKDGRVVADHDFGWDTTPAIYRHGDSYSIIIKDNSYGTDEEGLDLGPFAIKQLSRDLKVEWSYLNSNKRSCVRLETGEIQCNDKDDHPNGFEWCINAPVVDKEGTVFANSEDGNLYAIRQGGTEKGRIFLEMAVAAAYTPLALDGQGRIYTMNDGKLSVIGK